jgi:hypothetical protein
MRNLLPSLKIVRVGLKKLSAILEFFFGIYIDKLELLLYAILLMARSRSSGIIALRK